MSEPDFSEIAWRASNTIIANGFCDQSIESFAGIAADAAANRGEDDLFRRPEGSL